MFSVAPCLRGGCESLVVVFQHPLSSFLQHRKCYAEAFVCRLRSSNGLKQQIHGRAPIESWDETYVHVRHNTNRVVLSERRDGTNAEPYTWVREAGRGRVFYTAWGHDQRTWSNPEFQGQLENGLRWAAEKKLVLKIDHAYPLAETAQAHREN